MLGLLLRDLRDLEQVAARIAHVKSWDTLDRPRIGNDLDAGVAKSFFGGSQINNRKADVTRPQRSAFFALNREM